MTKETLKLFIQLGKKNIKELSMHKPKGYKSVIARWEKDIQDAKEELGE